MSVITLQNQVLGPFKSIETLSDRLRADDADYPFSVIGTYEINEDDSLAPVPVAPPPSVSDYIAAMEAHYDTKAQERRYDNRLTCALRAGYPGPFQPEGQAFAIWMDTCNALGYQIMGEVLSGQRPVPTVTELIADLPVLEWPI